jgi:hypothetical protein
MKMTLDEAIKHCLEVAKENYELADKFDEWDEWEKADADNCRECAADHRQLAEWLTELKEAKRLLKHGYWIEEEPRVLKCSVCGEYAPMNYLGQNCIDSRYCPWCGTKMDSNADEPWQSE